MTQSNLIITHKTAIFLGFSGMLGALVLFAGDMLFYYNGAQTDFITNMSVSSDARIIASGITALIAAWLYTLGAGQIYYAFQPAKTWVRLMVFLSFAAIMITYGVVHGAYIAIATSAKNAAALGMAAESFTGLAITANNALRFMAYLPFAIFSLLFIPAVWLKHTHYPRWVILFSPVVLFLLRDLIVGNFEGGFKTIIGGGYLNLLLLLFFIASTIALHVNRKNLTE